MENTSKNTDFGEILQIYEAIKLKNLAKTQKDFAALLGIDPNTLSAALHNRARYNSDKVLRKARALAQAHGIEVKADNSSQALQVGDNFGEQKILSSDNARWFDLCAEKDKQIDRLLGIIEKMQQ